MWNYEKRLQFPVNIKTCCPDVYKRQHQSCLSQLSCKENGGRAVGTADDGDRCRCLVVESQEDSHEVCAVDTELGSSS